MGNNYSERRREDDSWHLDKRINISHILTTAAALVTILIWASTVETRLSLLDSKQIVAIDELKSINVKMDMVITDLSYMRGQAENEHHKK